MTITPSFEHLPADFPRRFGLRPALSSREIEVLLAWIDSDSKTEAGRRLFISQGTINTHLSRIREKYAAVGRPATTKAALVARALQDALIDIDDL
ncbi:response regulator transcription factor [Nocardia harenae]|uniref:response regulator transcription factor n=1 Tax=Nocardia harenae TaxID=358707 RepID=UPI00082D98A8|nr:LuxR C-terminal-related transcriptional regulator [Nocardia harenae]